MGTKRIVTKEKKDPMVYKRREDMKELLTEQEFIALFSENDEKENSVDTKKKIDVIIEKGLAKKGLNLAEVVYLLKNRSKENDEIILETAKQIKKEIYGNRIVIFAPLYIGNECINDCVYCGFRSSNKETVRITLNDLEIENEVKNLIKQGHKRLIVVYGEHPRYDSQYIKNTVDVVYKSKDEKGEIRRVNINAAPFDEEGFAMIKSAGIGTYQIFQETYHRETYAVIHPRGPKKDYFWRLYGLDRAMKAGIDDVGIGALLGLYDWKFELLSLLRHSFYLEDKFGVGPHTISFPRIEPAFGSCFSENPPYQINDEDFKIFVALLRITVPYTGLILTAREDEKLRNELISIGISQIDAGSSIGVGTYSTDTDDSLKKAQFILGDKRTLDEVIYELVKQKLIPSFCTGCYRQGRTGEKFMNLSKPGDIKSFCQGNAILTFAEYLIDYASERTKEIGWDLIKEEFEAVSNPSVKKAVQIGLDDIKNGKHDVYL